MQEMRCKEQDAINVDTCTISAIELMKDEFNNDDLYVEDEDKKSFEEVIQRANILFSLFLLLRLCSLFLSIWVNFLLL